MKDRGKSTSKTRKGYRGFLAPMLLVGAFALIAMLFHQVLFPFILAVIIVYLIEPVVRRMSAISVAGHFFPRWIAVIIVYLNIIGLVTIGALFVIPPLAGEFARLAEEAPQFLDDLRTEHVPDLNRRVQTLVNRFFPARISDTHVNGARAQIYEAFDVAESVLPTAILLDLGDPGSFGGFGEPMPDSSSGLEVQEVARDSDTGAWVVTIWGELIGAQVITVEGEEVQTEWNPEALRIRTDEVTGELVVEFSELELVQHPEEEDGFIVRMRDERITNTNTSSPAVDLERGLNESLTGFIEMSGEGLSKVIGVGQGLLVGLLNALVGIILTFMIAAFISIDLPGIQAYFRSMVPEASRDSYAELMMKLDQGLAGVVRGQLLICLVNGCLTAIGLLLLDVKFALILAVIATVLSLIPIFGTILSTIPAVGMALTQGFTVALLVLGWVLGIHLIEANVLNPKIMGSAAKIHPVLVVFALLAGEHAYGLMGALLAVPVASVLLTLFSFALARSANTKVLEEEVAP